MKSKKQETPVKNRRLDGYVVVIALFLPYKTTLMSFLHTRPHVTSTKFSVTSFPHMVCVILYDCIYLSFSFALYTMVQV